MNSHKTLFAILLLFVSLFSNLEFAHAESTETASTLSLTATNYILIDAKTGVVIAEKNADERRPIASLTKMMTALIALSEAKDLDATVTATHDCSNAGESEIYIEPGDKFRLRELLYAVLLKSANDAANLVAESVGGRMETFLTLMNRKAKALHLKNTHYANPHGLDAPEHYSSARDQAIVALTAMAYPEFRKMVSTKETTITWLNKDKYFKAFNHNKLLFRYPFIKGIKTGYTRKSGHCLATYAEVNGLKLITVVLNSKSAVQCYDDTMKLINYGIKKMKKVKLFSQKETIPHIYADGLKKYRLKAYADVYAELPENFEASKLSYKFVPTICVSKTEIYGVLKVFYQGKLVALSTADGYLTDD